MGSETSMSLSHFLSFPFDGFLFRLLLWGRSVEMVEIPHCGQGVCWCPWPVWSAKAMWMLVICAAAEAIRVDVSILRCRLRPCRCPRSRLPLRALSWSVVLLQLRPSVLSLETMWTVMAGASTDCKWQGSYCAVVAMAADPHLRKRDTAGFFSS